APELLRQYAADLEFTLDAQARAISHLQGLTGIVERIVQERQLAVFSPRTPLLLKGQTVTNSGRIHIDHVRGLRPRDGIVLRRAEANHLQGWAFAPEIDISGPETAAYLALTSIAGRASYFAPLLHRSRRHDVEAAHADVHEWFTVDCGFSAMVSCEQCPPGEYQLSVVHVRRDKAISATWEPPIVVG